MAEQTVKIVKIRGEGAGVSSIREVPLNWWNNANKPNSGNEKDVADWKIIPSNAPQDKVFVEPVNVKTPEEIMKEAEEAIANSEPTKVGLELEKKRGRPSNKPQDVKI